MADKDVSSHFSTSLLNSNRAPTPGELALARAMIAECDGQLAQVSVSVKEQLELYYSNGKHPILKRLALLKKIVAPIRRVPDEIVGEIFKACLLDTPHPSGFYETFTTTSISAAPQLLTHISSDLRKIALSMPVLWKSIHLDLDPKSGVRSSQLVKEWLTKRAANQPLRIFIDLPNCDPRWTAAVVLTHEAIINEAFACSSRWQHIKISIEMPTDTLWRRVRMLTPKDIPLLQALELDASLISNDPVPMLNCEALTKISGLTWHQVYQSIAQLSSLTHLDLEDIATVEVEDFANILRQCLSLVALTVYFCPICELIEIGEIKLPCLRYLNATEELYIEERDTDGRIVITEAFNTPQLEHLEYAKSRGYAVTTSALPLIARTTHLTHLHLSVFIRADELVKCLHHCLELTTLYLSEDRSYYNEEDFTFYDGLLYSLAEADERRNMLCPKLQNFTTDLCRLLDIASLHAFMAQRLMIAGSCSTRFRSLSLIVFCSFVDVMATKELLKDVAFPDQFQLVVNRL